MKPYNHISQLPRILKRFCIYLQSQNIKYEFYSADGKNFWVTPINSRFTFTCNALTLIRHNRNGDYWQSKVTFEFMPIREQILF